MSRLSSTRTHTRRRLDAEKETPEVETMFNKKKTNKKSVKNDSNNGTSSTNAHTPRTKKTKKSKTVDEASQSDADGNSPQEADVTDTIKDKDQPEETTKTSSPTASLATSSSYLVESKSSTPVSGSVSESQSQSQSEPALECITIEGNSLHKISCYSSQHPVFILSAAITCTIFITCFLLSRKRRTNSTRSTRNTHRWFGRWNPIKSKTDQGEYAALAVYDEILDDFDQEDLSSYGYSHADGSDDDSIGTIISQWSNGVGPGDGSGHGHGHGQERGVRRRIEMIPFDDGHLTLKEING